MLAESRRRAIADRVRTAGSVTVGELEARFGVSSMTARRDLAELERQGVVRRTHGGAVLPGVSAHEDSFAQRVETDAGPKAALAEAAVARVAPGETIYLDSSSTSYYVARRLIDAALSVTVLTNSLPVMELVAAQARPNVELIGIGGSLRRLTSSLVGPFAVYAVKANFADRLFLSVKGLAQDRTLTDADPLEAEVKRTMIARASESVLLLDRSKLSVHGLSAIGPLSDVDGVIAHGVGRSDLARLRASGVPIHAIGGES